MITLMSHTHVLRVLNNVANAIPHNNKVPDATTAIQHQSWHSFPPPSQPPPNQHPPINPLLADGETSSIFSHPPFPLYLCRPLLLPPHPTHNYTNHTPPTHTTSWPHQHRRLPISMSTSKSLPRLVTTRKSSNKSDSVVNFPSHVTQLIYFQKAYTLLPFHSHPTGLNS